MVRKAAATTSAREAITAKKLKVPPVMRRICREVMPCSRRAGGTLKESRIRWSSCLILREIITWTRSRDFSMILGTDLIGRSRYATRLSSLKRWIKCRVSLRIRRSS